MKISIIIKALNEEEKIANCIESILNTTRNYDAEVVLIDSISTDNTVEIAKKYPISIYQFSSIKDRNCGAAAQLGFLKSTGDFIYLIDGDMEFATGFLQKAIDYLISHENVAGVGGILKDTDITSISDQKRADTYKTIESEHFVSYLGGGGLYRREAIISVGYFSNPDLKACEEAELGVRLHSAGWKLARLPEVSVFHTGHKASTTTLMRRSLRNGRLAANGVFIKSSLGKPWWWRVLLREWFVVLPFSINFLNLMLIPILGFQAMINLLLIWIVIFLLISIKSRSFTSAVYSIFSWNLSMLASLSSIPKKIGDPERNIDSIRIL